MKNKKLCAGVLAASLMVSSMPFAPLTSPAQAASAAISQGVYKDIKGHKHEALLQRWIQEGKVKGDDQGQVNPDQSITRAELAAFINRVKGFTKTADISRFKDVKTDDWYATEVARAVQAGYLVGMGPDTFAPNGQVTAEQAIAVALRLSPLPNQSTKNVQVPENLKASPWAAEAVKQAIANGIFSQADLTESLTLSSKRADNILWLDRSLNKNPALSVPGTYSLGEVNNVDVQVPGVTLKNTTISGQLTVSAKAEKGNDTVTLDQVKLTKPVVAPKEIKVVQDGKSIETKAPDKKPDQSENKKNGTVTIGGSGHSGGSAKPARPSKPDKPAQPKKPE
ncbi:S-layer homology domain-containing protein, partial [Peptococcus simiae]|uniref:S-layer homology domain-containing protein n=1 Tax=Peptococcus simiae TaxID=1643805 RepID=UPI0039804B5D